MVRRRVSLLILALVVVLAALPLAGLTAAQGDKTAQELTIITDQQMMDWSNMRGAGSHTHLLSYWWAAPMYFDAEGKLHPMVFNKWTPNDSSTVWTFQIDPAAVFSDGSPITAEDVVGTWNLMARPLTRHQRIDLSMSGVVGYDAVKNGKADAMTGLVVKDPSTVEVTLGAADPIFYEKLASHLIAPTKISVTRGKDGEEVADWWNPSATGGPVVSSGPFMLQSLDLDKGTGVFVPNPHFWLSKPKLSKVTFIYVADQQIATAMLKNGQADLDSELLTPTVVDDLGKDFVSGPMLPKGMHFWFWQNHAPMDDINVRKALIMSVNSAELYKVAFPNGPMEPATQILSGIPGIDPKFEPYPYDPEAAKQALAASSYGSADKLPKLMFVGISTSAHEAAAQYIAEQWRQVLGIDRVEMKAGANDYSGPDQDSIQIFRDDVGARVPDAVTYLMGAIHSGSGNAKNKMGGYKNEEIDKLLQQASVLGVDDPQRNQLAWQAQKLFRDDYMYIPYFYQTASKYAMPWVKNYAVTIDENVSEPWNVYIDKGQ